MRKPETILACVLLVSGLGLTEGESAPEAPSVEITQPRDGELVSTQSFFVARLRLSEPVSENCAFRLYEDGPDAIPVGGCQATFLPVLWQGGPDGYKVRFVGGCWSTNPPYWEILVPQPDEVVVWKTIRILGAMDLEPGQSYRLTVQCDVPDWLFDEVYITVEE